MLTDLTRDSILGDGGGRSCQGDNGPVFHSWIVYYPKLTPYSHGADVPFTPFSPSLFLLQMSPTPASLLHTAGLNRSVERARQTNRHATSCVSGAGAASQYAKRINALRRGKPPTLTLPDHGAALQVSLEAWRPETKGESTSPVS